MFAAVSCWFEPIENGVRAAQRAREGLIAGGDLAYAGYTYQLAVPYCGLRAVAGALRRRGRRGAGLPAPDRQRADRPVARQLRVAGRVLRGEIDASDRSPSTGTPTTRCRCSTRISAARSPPPSSATRPPRAAQRGGDAAARRRRGLLRHRRGPGAARAGPRRAGPRERRRRARRAAAGARRGDALAGGGAPRTRRTTSCTCCGCSRPSGPGRPATSAPPCSPSTPRGARSRRAQRPWHRALIAERAARFHLAHGLEQAGHDLLAQARQEYLAWGATAKVAQLDWAYPAPQSAEPTRPALTTGTIDLLGILSASQALSSETSVERLHARVAEVLGAMTGATGVHLLLWTTSATTGCCPHPTVGSSRSTTPRRRCRCCATCSGRASRWSSPTPPATTASPATRTSPAPTAARCWPCRSSAAARCGRCWCWRTASSAARSRPSGSTRSSSSPASSPSRSTTPSCTRS